MKQKKSGYVIAIIGVLLLGSGFYLVKTINNPQGVMLTLPYVCIGIGCGLFGHGMGSIISEKAMQSDPQMQKRVKIEQNDERNMAIADRAKGKAFEMMTLVFGMLMLVFTLMGVDLTAILLLVFAYLFVHGYAIYCRCKYEKEM